jgi:hypothetical protein
MTKRTANNQITEQASYAGLRQQAERLEIPGFSKMRKSELVNAVTEAQSSNQNGGENHVSS